MLNLRPQPSHHSYHLLIHTCIQAFLPTTSVSTTPTTHVHATLLSHTTSPRTSQCSPSYTSTTTISTTTAHSASYNAVTYCRPTYTTHNNCRPARSNNIDFHTTGYHPSTPINSCSHSTSHNSTHHTTHTTHTSSPTDTLCCPFSCSYIEHYQRHLARSTTLSTTHPGETPIFSFPTSARHSHIQNLLSISNTFTISPSQAHFQSFPVDTTASYTSNQTPTTTTTAAIFTTLPPPPPPPPPTNTQSTQPHKRPRGFNSPPRRSQPVTLKPNPHSTPLKSTTPTPPPTTDTTEVAVQRRPPNMPLPRFQRPTDPAQLEIFQWINQHACSMHIRNEPMISYVSKVLAAAHLNSTHFTDIQLLTHLKWNEETQRNDHHEFIVLIIPALANRGDAPILPPPRREALNIPAVKDIFAAHVSEEGNIISILQAREGEVIRSILHDTQNVGFFCQAFELTNHEDHDATEAARVLFNASNMSKNRSGLILTLKAYGQGQQVTHRGESAANDLLLRGEGMAKYTPGKCWAVHPKHGSDRRNRWEGRCKATP